jgi:formylglycine-generating enzyme required for sulfatase activity
VAGQAFEGSQEYISNNMTYIVIDLSGGSTSTNYPVRYTNEAPDLTNYNCRSKELWLRRIPAGTFTMGSPTDEVGRFSNETQHQVTLTQDFFIGIFECTQAQWSRVMGSNPSDSYYSGAYHPVDKVSYDMIRGSSSEGGAGWPRAGHVVDATSFMGKLRAKTGLMFDLPTSAQWEYACRAGTTTALNSGKNLTSASSDIAMSEVGCYRYKDGYRNGHMEVGSYLPNAWGLYDMHGNVQEWCLDWYIKPDSTSAGDPVGPTTGTYRILRGGCFWHEAENCRSARISYDSSSGNGNFNGVRVFCQP